MFIANVVSTESGGWRIACKAACFVKHRLVKANASLLLYPCFFYKKSRRQSYCQALTMGFFCQPHDKHRLISTAYSQRHKPHQANTHIRITRLELMADFQIRILYHDMFGPCLLAVLSMFCLPKVEGVVRVLGVDNGLLQDGLRKWKCCGIESSAFFKLQQYIVLMSSHDRREQIMPRPGIEPGTFQIFGLTLSQT